jgi:hypothetical protein
MKITIETIPEPELDFGYDRFGVEPRRMLAVSRGAGAEIGKLRLALVGPAAEVEITKCWLEGMSRFRPARESNASRYRDWPGWRAALGVDLVIEKRFVRNLSDVQVQLGLRSATDGPGFDSLVKMFVERIQGLFGDDRPDCVVVCLPEALGDLRVENPGLSVMERDVLRRLQAEEEGDQLRLFAPTPEELRAAEELRMQADELLFRTFYRALKARVMEHANPVPLQVIRRDTVERADDKGQSHATRAWHLGVSMLYKSGRTPWQPASLPANTCFVGISFHYLKRRAGGIVYASLAQAISTEFEPFALSGASIDQDQRRDRRPYLNEDQSRALLEDVLREYEARVGVSPDRVVFHKTSAYQPEEIVGFQKAAAGRISSCELVWLRSTSLRLVRKGQQEPWRGTLCIVGDEYYLFTMGFMRWWREYPGPHIPAPVEIGSASETDLRERAREILALTKMNWNSSEGVSRYPVTLSFAKKVGEIMTELPDGKVPNPSYRFYM